MKDRTRIYLQDNIFKTGKIISFETINSGGVSDVYKVRLVDDQVYYCKVIIPGKVKMLDKIPSDLRLFFSKNRQKYEVQAVKLFKRYSNKFILPPIYKYDIKKRILILKEIKGKLLSENLSTCLNKSLVEKLAAAAAELVNNTYKKVKFVRRRDEDEKIRKVRVKYLYSHNFDKIKTSYPEIKKLIHEFTKISRRQRSCLCHGDYQPKNVIVTNTGRIGLIDFEEAIVHDPAFDISFFLARLILSSVQDKGLKNKILSSAKLLIESFLNRLQINEDRDEIQYRINHYTAGAIMLRVDGISRQKWMNKKQAELLRKFSANLIIASRNKTVDLLNL